jgi:hypothetical protein
MPLDLMCIMCLCSMGAYGPAKALDIFPAAKAASDGLSRYTKIIVCAPRGESLAKLRDALFITSSQYIPQHLNTTSDAVRECYQ